MDLALVQQMEDKSMGAVRWARWCSLGAAVGCLPTDHPDDTWAEAGRKPAMDCCGQPSSRHVAQGCARPQKVRPKKVPAFLGDFPFGPSPHLCQDLLWSTLAHSGGGVSRRLEAALLEWPR